MEADTNSIDVSLQYRIVIVTVNVLGRSTVNTHCSTQASRDRRFRVHNGIHCQLTEEIT